MITGIPSGLDFAGFDAFGIYTRLTATGFQDETDQCTRTATSPRAHPRVRQHGVQLALRFRRVKPHRFKGSPAHVSTLSGPGSGPVSGRLYGTVRGGADHLVPVSRRLTAHRRSLLEHPVPARGLGLRYLRLTGDA